MPNELLVINGDDFGAREESNLGIMRAYRNGLVRSASLMVNMPAAQQAAQIAKSAPGLEIGLHLNISEGFCTASARDVPLLIDQEGKFRFNSLDIGGSIERFKRTLTDHPGMLDQVAREFDSQIQRFYDLGLALGHINIHHYLSLIDPRLFETYVRAAEVAGVPFRGLCYPILDLLGTAESEVEQMKNIIRDCSVPCPTISLSNLLETSSEPASDDEYREMIESTITSLTASKHISNLEIITHPAEISPDSFLKDSYARTRKMETHLTISREFQNFVERQGYQIARYADLAAV